MQILFQFDVRTAALFVAMTFFVQATVIAAQACLIGELKQYRGVIAALLANLFAAVGLMLRLFADQLPVFLTTILSNILILTGMAMFYIALSFFWSMGFILMASLRLRNELMEVATMDVRTRLPNRRATQAFLEKELSRAQRIQSEFSDLLIDIDNFKQVNDRWGHASVAAK